MRLHLFHGLESATPRLLLLLLLLLRVRLVVLDGVATFDLVLNIPDRHRVEHLVVLAAVGVI